MNRKISNFVFQHIGTLTLKRAKDGRPIEYNHRLVPGIKPHRHAAGPFCDFDLPRASNVAGIYALTVDETVTYIGETERLRSRFGSGGYGHIAPRNCHRDGQSTNCKINARVLKAFKAMKDVHVWFMASREDRKYVESRLVAELSPPWNGSRSTARDSAVFAPSASSNRPFTSDRFTSALLARLAKAEDSGRHSTRVRSGDLHRRVGGYPGSSHHMPQCCRIMRAAMLAGDRVIEAPRKGAGANLVIEYRLPRP
jgi:hypothetical protein